MVLRRTMAPVIGCTGKAGACVIENEAAHIGQVVVLDHNPAAAGDAEILGVPVRDYGVESRSLIAVYRFSFRRVKSDAVIARAADVVVLHHNIRRIDVNAIRIGAANSTTSDRAVESLAHPWTGHGVRDPHVFDGPIRQSSAGGIALEEWVTAGRSPCLR